MTGWLWVVPAIDHERALRFLGALRVPPDEVLVIDNCAEALPRTEFGRVLRTGRNLGCARSWNIGVRAVLDEHRPGLIVASPSVELGPAGGLDFHAALAEFDGSAITAGECSWHLKAWSASALRRLGFFDERFWPLYYEDSDWNRRAVLAGIHESPSAAADVHIGPVGLSIPLVDWALDFGHLGAYYKSKWGGLPPDETFSTPFGLDTALGWWPGCEYAGVT